MGAPMDQPSRIEDLLDEGFTLEVCRYPDTPLRPGDRLLAREPEASFLLVARAPLLLRPSGRSAAL